MASFNPQLTTDDKLMYSSCNFGCMLSVSPICSEDRFCASNKGGIGGGGVRVTAQGAVHTAQGMAAALAGCQYGVRAHGSCLGWLSAWGAVHMVAALAGCRKALVGTGLGISFLFDTNGCR